MAQTLKKVAIEQLKVGMYIQDLNCDWMSHPFLRQQFRVTSARDITRLIDAGIREVYIDVELGEDVPHSPTQAEVNRAIDDEMKRAATQGAQPAVMMREELESARCIMAEATRIVRDIMQDVRLGQQVSMEKVDPIVERITRSVLRNSGALLCLLRVKNKDDYTFVHSVSVCALLVSFGRTLGMGREAIHHLGVGGMLHDIGKVAIPDDILNKPGRLTDEEFHVIKTHASESRRMLAATPGISREALQIAGEHHERHDGSGYPDGLKGDAISPMGQMAAICDVYDAMTSDRVYHKGLAPTEGLRKIFEWSKFHFNADLVHAFLRTIGIYPTGSLVMLESGRLAVVVEQNERNLLKPTVRIVFHGRACHYLPPEDLDLSRPLGQGGGDRIVGHELPTKWRIDPMRFL